MKKQTYYCDKFMRNGYKGKMGASVGGKFCESLPLSVLKEVLISSVGQGRITISIRGMGQRNFTEEDKDI